MLNRTGAFRNKFRNTALTLAAAGILVASSPVFAQSFGAGWSTLDVSPGKILLLDVSLNNSLIAGQIGDVTFEEPAAMRAFYSNRSGRSFWHGPEGLNGRAHALLSVLEDSWTHGLNPEHYHVSEIERLIGHPLAAQKARLELLMTDALVRYARDLSGMRIDPATIRQKAEYWTQPDSGFEILQAAGLSSDFESFLDGLAPQGRFYHRLREELVSLVNEPDGNYDHVLPLQVSRDYIFPGEREQVMPDLRVRLGLSEKGEDPFLFDDALSGAVMKFQRVNNLEPDGIIGPKTLDLLNQSRAQKIQQVIANLERLRWQDREMPSRYIVVNTASQMLWAIENGRVRHEMKVVVGKPWRKTKEFKAEITGIRLNPDWTVPPSIKRYDIWPQVKKDPQYLTEKGIEIFHGYGRNRVSLDPLSIDWHNLSLRELHDIRMIQFPGEHNPLGQVRVLMQNPYNIYLHDTNHRELFSKAERALSSGCIRMEHPEKIARFVLEKNGDWGNDRIKSTIAKGALIDIEAAENMPVYILYQSIWPDSRGNLVFGADIYGHDKKLIEVLAAENGFYVPDPSEIFTGDEEAKTLVSASLNP